MSRWVFGKNATYDTRHAVQPVPGFALIVQRVCRSPALDMSAVKIILGTAEALTYAATLTAKKSSDHLSFEATPNHHVIVSNTCFTGSDV